MDTLAFDHGLIKRIQKNFKKAAVVFFSMTAFLIIYSLIEFTVMSTR